MALSIGVIGNRSLQAGNGIGRLIVDPYSLLLFSSRAEDFNAINAKRAAGMDVSEAIDAVLRDRGLA